MKLKKYSIAFLTTIFMAACILSFTATVRRSYALSSSEKGADAALFAGTTSYNALVSYNFLQGDPRHYDSVRLSVNDIGSITRVLHTVRTESGEEYACYCAVPKGDTAVNEYYYFNAFNTATFRASPTQGHLKPTKATSKHSFVGSVNNITFLAGKPTNIYSSKFDKNYASAKKIYLSIAFHGIVYDEEIPLPGGSATLSVRAKDVTQNEDLCMEITIHAAPTGLTVQTDRDFVLDDVQNLIAIAV